MCPTATPRGGNLPGIKLPGNGVVAFVSRSLNLMNDRQHIGRKTCPTDLRLVHVDTRLPCYGCNWNCIYCLWVRYDRKNQNVEAPRWLPQ
jgi:hypothetical protein